MKNGSYGEFCPVAMAAELLCTRWTMLIVRELVAGATRFNELRRGMPRVPPALLSQRLRALEEAGIVKRTSVPDEPEVLEYQLTDSGSELEPVVRMMGRWGQRWISSEATMERLDARLLMWNMRRTILVEPRPSCRQVVQFNFPDAPKNGRKWWLLAEPSGHGQVCALDPGYDVDLYVTLPLGLMTAIWMGHESFAAAVADDRLTLVGDRRLAQNLRNWLRLNPFAHEERQVA
jgi:DNA-binding HxlR family transcriptional regulator